MVVKPIKIAQILKRSQSILLYALRKNKSFGNKLIISLVKFCNLKVN